MKPLVLALFAALFTTACGGGGGSSTPAPAPSAPSPVVPVLPDPSGAPALKTLYGFSFGAAIEPAQMDSPTEATLLRKHFSSVTAENVMKPDTIGPTEGAYNFAPADQLVDFARTNNMRMRGHTLVWHRTAPAWFFAGDQSDPVAYRALVRRRLENYIVAVLTHFRGSVHAWDVVNEVASDIPGQAYRTDSPWFVALGPDYIEHAFRAARAADPQALLFINDYNTELAAKRANVMTIVQELINKGVPIDGVGHQLHLQVNASVGDVEQALSAVESLNLRNQVTELDVSIYADPGSCFASATGCAVDYGSTPPQSALSQQARLYRSLFQLFRNHDARLDSVTTWGIADNHTWLNSWPVARTNHPLLFDRQQLPKAAFWAVADPAFVIP